MSFAYTDNNQINHLTLTDTTTQKQHSTRLTYNAQHLLDSIDGPRTDVTDIIHFTYDAQGNRTSIRNALNHTIQLRDYDAHGRAHTLEDPNGRITRLTYDARGRLNHSQTGGEGTTYVYDTVGNLTRISSTDGNELTLTYNDARQLTRITDHLNNSLDFSLNETGQLSSMTYPSGKVLSYHYTDAELTRLELDGNPILSNLQYQPFGPIKAWTWGNGATHTRSFDLDGRLSTHKLHQDTRSLSYDNADRITGLEDSIDNRTYQYDDLHRLTQAQHKSTELTWAYDPNSNRITQTDNGETTDYTVDELSNQLLASASPTIQQNLEYDANGNTLSDGNHEYGYDARNRLTSLNNGQVTYGINAFGLRVKKTFAASQPRQPTGDRFTDHFEAADNTLVLDRESNTW